MGKKIILAVAGSGKTYYICRNLNPCEKNLILAYTHSNIKNIKKELIDAWGNIPQLTTILTFDSFVNRYMLCPYEPTILNFFEKVGFKSNGITLKTPPSQSIVRGKKRFNNPHYHKKEYFEHYNTNGFYYCKTMTELIMYVKEGKKKLIKRIASNINLFFDHILIDEYQDFREHDYDLIMELAKNLTNITMVGDYFQHSVSAINNAGKPFATSKGEVSYKNYIDSLKKANFNIDNTILSKSRRCSPKICDFVFKKIGIEIYSTGDQKGNVYFVESDFDTILKDDGIVKLVYNSANKFIFNALNWSYSKGDTLNNTCVILTEAFDEIQNSEFKYNGSPSTRNKIYVALTRTKGDLYIIINKDFKKVKNKYIK